ncbi:MAG: hypothetical protein CSA11_07815 [Chloroflexi bacterium]|nr:MAG: hypothetical protein CSB13_08100 [Chloroflexota bacterium]PIE80499.1 MAG: hypothetical protein CSA11_07815 [Chloroflexota bacterium]
MRLEKKKDEEIAARKGMTGKTILTFIWLIISTVVAYGFINYLIDIGILSYSMFYSVGLPRLIPEWVITIVLVLVVVVLIQIFLFFGFVIVSPEGRRKTGTPTAYSRKNNSFDQFDNGRRD